MLNWVLNSYGNSISFTSNGIASATPYVISVAVTSSGGCVSTSTVSVSVDLRNDVLNSTTTTTQLLDLVKAGVVDPAISSYQWFRWTPPRSNISGNNQNSITLSSSSTAGDYGVEATYSDGCKNVYAIIGTTYGNKNGHGVKTKIPVKQNKAANPAQPDNISLQPNPARNSVTVTLPDWKANTGISVIDTKGNLLFKRTAMSQRQNINTSTWANGEYTVIIREPNGRTTAKKLVIQNH